MRLWQPSEEFIDRSNLTAFLKELKKNHGLQFNSYEEVHHWSIENIGDFWESIASYFKVDLGSYSKAFVFGNPFFKTKWFEGAQLSYAKELFKHSNVSNPALVYQSEVSELKEVSWDQLKMAVASLQEHLKTLGVQKGDRVVAYALNTPETVVAFLAANSLGAIWSSCSPDFGVSSVVDRFSQIEPKVFFAHQYYQYNGKGVDLTNKIAEIQAELPTVEAFITLEESLCFQTSESELSFELVGFDHPIWVLYSSGTTGKPKAITHRTGGMVLEHLKALALHQNVKVGERYFWYSTTGWMMWNYALSSLLCGATLCMYDGAATAPTPDHLFTFAKEAKIDHFGAGAAFYTYVMQHDLLKDHKVQLPLKTIGSTGSPLSAEAFDWLYEQLPNTQLISLSGGTDICSIFMGGNPLKPVYTSEIQSPCLGVDLQAWNDESVSVIDQLGELIINRPMPSMPVYFWKDQNFERYTSSYFETYEGVWCHGDYIKITKHNGIIIYGRSDATLNKNGVRIGTAEIYSALDEIDEIQDSLIVNIEQEDGSSFMPLFVQTSFELDEQLQQKIKTQLRTKCSPRHVPDAIVSVEEIPYTISGKKMEVPVKKILMGVPLEKAATLDAMRNPSSLQGFVTFATKQTLKG